MSDLDPEGYKKQQQRHRVPTRPVDYTTVTFNKEKLVVRVTTSDEVRSLIERGEFKCIKDVVGTLTVELETYVWALPIDSGVESKTLVKPETWFDGFLVETRIGRLIAKWRQPRFKSHTLTVEWRANVTVPKWLPEMSDTFGHYQVAIGHDVRYKAW